MPETPSIRGTKEEQQLFTEVNWHYDTAKEDLEVRRADFDKKDILFRSHIPESGWPYTSLVFDPRIFTSLFEKSSRILANKPRGRMVPREGGDSLGAKINNELLNFQWDENERVDGMPMLAKWAMMDLNTRKYGASFGLVKWQYEKKNGDTFYDGPNFKPLANRDCLPNPAYSTIKNWFQYRDYVTLQELETVNDAARSRPIYKNLDILRQTLQAEANEKGGDTREANYISKNKSIKGLTDYLGKDPTFKTVEIITEYRDDKWITFAPKHGVVLRDIDNPYKHGQIPVVMLKYYPIDDDLYGLSEIEPVEKLQRAINALVCQYLDSINMSLYAPLKIRATGGAVQMHTLEFGPGKKWLMNDPQTDVIAHESSPAGVTEFTSTYRFLVSAMQEALGETSQGISNLAPGESQKTATEVRDLATSRSARDNYNQIFLSEALKKQMTMWHTMNQQFLFSSPQEKTKIIRIVGKDAIKYFQKMGLDGEGMTDESIDTLLMADDEGITMPTQDMMEPLYPVQVGDETVPKFQVEEDGSYGELLMEPSDVAGTYDFIPDIESMQLPDEATLLAAKKQMIELALNPVTTQLLMQQDYQLNVKELMEDFFEQLGTKDADKYFEKLEVNPMQNGQIDPQTGQPIGPGAGGVQPSLEGMADGGLGGMAGGAQAVPNGQAQPVVPGSQPLY